VVGPWVVDPALARVTLARKLAAVALRLWKAGERYGPEGEERDDDMRSDFGDESRWRC